jgi:diguanylate cyclase (GGDEF)-like protein/PAS domain S-box-containing protein
LVNSERQRRQLASKTEFPGIISQDISEFESCITDDQGEKIYLSLQAARILPARRQRTGEWMQKELQRQIREATRSADGGELDFSALLPIIDEYYNRMAATVTQSLSTTITPIQVIFDSVTDALLSVSDNGVIQNCNKVCSRYFGLSKETLIGSPLERILPGARGQAVSRFLEPFMSNLDDTSVEFSGCEVDAARDDGTSFTGEIKASELTAGDDLVYVISLRDVTGLRQAEKTLKENEERYRALVENAPEAIVVLDVEKNVFTDANHNACELFNLSRSRLLKVGPEAVSPTLQPDGTPSFGIRRGYVDEALNGGHPTFEWTHKDADGDELPCEVRFSRLPDGERKLLRVSITNISDRKRDDEFRFAQNKILEMIASSKPFDRTLRSVCRCTEKVGLGLRAAIMLLNIKNQTLNVEEAPSFSEQFRLSLDFIRVGSDGVSCAAAVFENQPKIAIDTRIGAHGEHLPAGSDQIAYEAVWSFPIHGTAGHIIGTLDIYLDRSRSPTTEELDKIHRMARLAGIAIKRRMDEEQLKNSELRYRDLFENVVDGVYIASRDGEMITVNPALVEMLGYDSVQDLKQSGRTTDRYVNPADRARALSRLEADGFVRNFEYRLRCKNGKEIVVLENSRAIYDDEGQFVAHEGTITDITERKVAETRVFEEKERAQVTLQSIGDGVITTDADGRVDYINPVAQALTGWDVRGATGKPINEIMSIVNEQTRKPVNNPVTRCLKEGRVITLSENSVLIDRDGKEVPVQDSVAPIRDRLGNIIGAVIVFHDVSRESRLFRQLAYQASHDTLTGLINRREFENRLEQALEGVHANSSPSHAILYMDLDQFQVINDTFGHTAGDELLREVTELVRENIRNTDVLARLGGDEFGLLLYACDEQRAIDVAEKIRDVIENHRFGWKDSVTKIRCSIGVVIVDDKNLSAAELLSSADVACYSAKDSGRNQVLLYQGSNASMRHEEMKWVSRITNAIDDKRFELFYQPIIGIRRENTDSWGHYELLLRMRGEDGELVNPGAFVPAAERYNLMPTIDRWVIREALTRLADRDSRADQAKFTLAINLSGTSLSDDRFLEFVTDELQNAGLPDKAICFEITETAAISNLSRVVHFMQTVKSLGCMFSLDDFGSGLSSFTYLKNLPVDYLKIDGQFIHNVAEDRVDESMVKAINEVGRAMGIQTIAEQVESKEVLDKLGEIGVEYAQGFYIARPASVQSFEPWADTLRATVMA